MSDARAIAEEIWADLDMYGLLDVHADDDVVVEHVARVLAAHEAERNTEITQLSERVQLKERLAQCEAQRDALSHLHGSVAAAFDALTVQELRRQLSNIQFDLAEVSRREADAKERIAQREAALAHARMVNIDASGELDALCRDRERLRTALRDLIDAIPEPILTNDPPLRCWVEQGKQALAAYPSGPTPRSLTDAEIQQLVCDDAEAGELPTKAASPSEPTT